MLPTAVPRGRAPSTSREPAGNEDASGGVRQHHDPDALFRQQAKHRRSPTDYPAPEPDAQPATKPLHGEAESVALIQVRMIASLEGGRIRYRRPGEESLTLSLPPRSTICPNRQRSTALATSPPAGVIQNLMGRVGRRRVPRPAPP